MPPSLLDALNSGATILTANPKLARWLLYLYDETQKKSGREFWPTPSIIPFSTWIKNLWTQSWPEQHILSELQSRKLWETLIQQDTDVPRLDLLHLQGSAAHAAEAYALIKKYRLPVVAEDFQWTHETQSFRKWMNRYEQRLKEWNAIDIPNLLDAVQTAMKNGEIPIPGDLVFSGFQEVDPQFRMFLDFLKSENVSIQFFGEERGQLPRHSTKISHKSHIEVREYKDPRQEVVQCSRWIRHVYQPGQTIGVILLELPPYRNLLKREFAAELTPETVFPWREKEPPLNISYAGPLAQEPLVQLALLILSAPSEAIPLLNLSALLESSFLSGGQSEAPQRKSLDLKLRRKKIVTFYLNQAKDFIDRREAPIFFSILSSWRQLIGERAKKSPGDWARYFSQFLKKIGWPMGNGALTSRTNEVYEAWKDCLDSFASLSKLLGPVTRLQAALTLSQLAEEKPYQPKSSQKPIQVVGLQDSPGMTFDHLWLMGSHEDVLPARPFLNSFLPVEIQKKYGLPHSSANWELQFAERSLARLVDSAQSVIISFPAWDESKELRISPLLKSLTQPHPLPEISQSHKLVDQLHMHSKLETWMDPQEIPLTTQEKTIFKEDGVPGGQQVLKNQAACPFKAFAIHRLHTEKIEAPEEVFDPAERGQLVHKALELFWREVKSRKFLKILSQNGELKDTIENCVKNTMDKNSGFRKLKFQPRFAQLEFDRVVLLLTQWMDIELLRSDFEVLEIEKKEVIHISDLSLNVRIDRVDKVAGDKILLIDYKTGDVVPSEWFKERSQEPQLPLYALKLQPHGIAFALIKKDEKKSGYKAVFDPDFPLTGVKKVNFLKSTPCEHWQDLMDHWQNILNTLAQQFIEGKIAVDPVKADNTCKNCGHEVLCRKEELGLNGWDISEELESS